MNILIIDDQQFIRETLKADIYNCLAEREANIYEASNGNQGIELITSLEVTLDLIIIDLKMELGDGIVVINILASEPRFQTIPIAMISSSDKRTLELVSKIISALKLNLLGVFAKPVKFYDILMLLNAVVAEDKTDVVLSQNDLQQQIELNVQQLLEDEQFILCYQPKIDLKTQKIVGFEVLSRLCDRQYGYIYPDKFLPIINQQGLNHVFTQMVISQAIKCWLSQPLLAEFSLSINITANELTCDELIEYIIECNRSYSDIHLVIELTETQEIINKDKVLNSIVRLIINNIDISLDDFGKSYSTYDRLDTIPFNEIKIDRSFVSDMDVNHQHYLIVESIIALAQKMHVKVVAEGVETATIAAILCGLGCDIAQGYLYSPPIEGRYLIDWIDQYQNN